MWCGTIVNPGKGRHPLTAELVTQSMLGVFIRLVMIMANVGTGNELARMGVVTQSVTVLEQFLRLILELDMDRGRGARRIVIRSVRGLSRAVALAESRIEASASTFQSAKSIMEMAEWRGIPVLRRLLKTHGRRLRWLFRTRHALTHTVGIVRFNEARAYAIVRDVICAVLAGRPRYMTALLLVEGRAMSLVGRYANARRAYEGVLGVCGRLDIAGKLGAWVHTCAGHAHARLGREGEAEACYKKAQEVDPGYALAYHEMGHLMVRAGRPEEALFMYKGSIGADPDYVPARIARGHALGVARDSERDVLAIECHEDALRFDSEELSARAGCGLALAMMGQYESAARWYRRAIEKDPDDAAGRTGLANSLAALGRNKEAIKEYRAAVSIAYRMDFGSGSGRESEATAP